MIDLKVSFDTDKQTAMADTRYWAALALSAEEKTSVEDPLQMEKLADALPLEQAASRWIVSIDPDEQVERVRSYVELGFRHPVFRARAGPGQIRPSLFRTGDPQAACGARLMRRGQDSGRMSRRGKRGRVRPPSRTTEHPVMKSNSGSQSRATTFAISVSVTSRPSGVPAMAARL
jgi:hypothetical protein